MQTVEAGIRELKSQLSAYLRQVKAGERIVITERGRPIGRLVPIAQTVEEQLERLSQVGLIAWNGQRLEPLQPLAQVQGARTVADLVLEDRE